MNELDLTRIYNRLDRIEDLFEAGQDSLSKAIVRSHLLEPLRAMLRMSEDRMTERWITQAEAMRRAQKSKNFFEKPLASLGGVSRLQKWEGEGLAAQTAEGIWLISPDAVPGHAPGPETKKDASTGRGLPKPRRIPGVQDICDEFLN